MPVDAVSAIAAGPEFQLPALESTPAGPEGGGFASALGKELDKLDGLQQEAAVQSQALAAGTADDVTSVVMAVERASLSMQLAVQLRNKTVEAYQDLFRMQV